MKKKHPLLTMLDKENERLDKQNTKSLEEMNTNMRPKLYRAAYKFLKLRANNGNPLEVLDSLVLRDRETVKKFLRYNHQVKFI